MKHRLFFNCNLMNSHLTVFGIAIFEFNGIDYQCKLFFQLQDNENIRILTCQKTNSKFDNVISDITEDGDLEIIIEGDLRNLDILNREGTFELEDIVTEITNDLNENLILTIE